MNLFLDSSVLLAACGSANGASRALFQLARENGWALLTSNYVLSEVERNLGSLSPASVVNWRGSRRGEYLVAWNSQNLDTGDDIAVAFVHQDKSVSTRFVLNSNVPADQIHPGIAATPEGFVAVWTAEGPLTTRRDVFMRRFDNDGVPLGKEVRVNTYTAVDQSGSVVAAALPSLQPQPNRPTRLNSDAGR